MQKPTIFFSHSSKDKRQLLRLKEMFVEKTGASIDVFLSCDGESVPFGRNWVHQIEDALGKAALMIVFVSPRSLRSSWLYFESGFAYSKGIKVVPVGFDGIDLSSLAPPISLLQGFNITSEAGLNNIIALVNEEFGHRHVESFSIGEFRELRGIEQSHSISTFGDYGSWVDHIQIDLTESDGLEFSPQIALEKIASLLGSENVDYEQSRHAIEFHGMKITAPGGISPTPLRFQIYPGVADVALPVFEKVCRHVRSDSLKGVEIRIDFVQSIECVTSGHKLTGRVYGTDVKLAPKGHLVRRDLKFQLGHLMNYGAASRGPTCLTIEILSERLPAEQIPGLLDLLFQKGILFHEPERSSEREQ